jgi:excisionase family DNA binding protein
MTTDIAPAVFNVSDAATYLHMGLNEVRTKLKTGELVGWSTAGGHWRVSQRACDEWIERMEGRVQ